MTEEALAALAAFAAASRTDGSDLDRALTDILPHCSDPDVRTALSELSDVLEPAQVAAVEHLLADRADRGGYRAEAVGRWERARARFVDDEHWGGAAEACAMLAWMVTDPATNSAPTAADLAGAAGLWREAADFAALDGAAEEAREHAAKAVGLQMALIDRLGAGQSARAVELAVAGRRFAVRYGMVDAGAALAGLLVLFGADVDWPWRQVHEWAETARVEYRGLGLPIDDLEPRLARIDVFEGAAAVGRGLPVEAEPPLRAAHRVAAARGLTALQAVCVRLLGGIRGFTGPTDVGPIAHLLARTDWSDDESEAASLVVQAMADRQSGGGRADDLLAEARSRLSGIESGHKAVLLDILQASRALESGDVEPARRCLAEVETYIARHRSELPGTALRGIALATGVLRIGVAARTDGADAMIEAQRVEDELLHSGAGLLAAQMASGRARLLLEAGRFRLALDTVLPAVLALDAVRFTFVEADRRRRWSAVVAEGMDVAFRAAVATRDHRTVAELIEVTRGNGVPLPQDRTSADPMSELLAEIPPPGVYSAASPPLPGPGIAAGLLGTGRTMLGLPAGVRTPWSTDALAVALDTARRYHAPVRAATVAEWRVPS